MALRGYNPTLKRRGLGLKAQAQVHKVLEIFNFNFRSVCGGFPRRWQKSGSFGESADFNKVATFSCKKKKGLTLHGLAGKRSGRLNRHTGTNGINYWVGTL